MNIKKFRILFCSIKWDLHIYIYLFYIYVDISINENCIIFSRALELTKISNKYVLFFFFINDINFYKHHFSSSPLFYYLFSLPTAYKSIHSWAFFFFFFFCFLRFAMVTGYAHVPYALYTMLNSVAINFLLVFYFILTHSLRVHFHKFFVISFRRYLCCSIFTEKFLQRRVISMVIVTTCETILSNKSHHITARGIANYH